MDGSVFISSPAELVDGMEIQIRLTFTNTDFIDCSLPGDVVLALQQTLRSNDRFGDKLAAIVALVASVQDKNLNPVLRLKRSDFKPPRKR